MKKVFVYYSLTGNGDVVADYFRGKKYDIEKIISEEELPNIFILRMLVGGYKSFIGYKDVIKKLNVNINSYDEIVIGSPIWNGRLASPINRLLEKIDFSNKKITIVFYSGSGKIEKALRQLDKICHDYKVINLVQPNKNKLELKKLDDKE